MPGVWRLEESRLVQNRTVISAANDNFVSVGFPGPPRGKLWVVTAATYKPSTAETQVVAWEKVGADGTHYALINPVSQVLNPAVSTFIEQGMEYLLFPGEYVIARRGDHTAGSTMSATIQIIEIDQPLYTYDEPQIVKRQTRAISSIRQQLGGGAGGGAPMVGPRGGPGRPGGGGPAPV